MSTYILAIDQGTTSSRAILFDPAGEMAGMAQMEITQYYPADGHVEHDPLEIFESVKGVCEKLLNQKKISAAQIAAIGITNQRETTVVWDRATGAPIHRAIVWQDRRTAEFCRRLKKDGAEAEVQAKTGLLLDPYFSGSKIRWILDHVDGARDRAERGELAYGTIDAWLLWRLTEGRVFATDATNASRTALYNIKTNQWDAQLLDLFQVPAAGLPRVLNSADDFGVTRLFGGEIPILAMVGDQQGATFGQACFEPGMAKATYGTGCFVMINTGSECVTSNNRLLSTIAWRLDGQTTYALEGSIFIAGAAVQWLRDKVGMVTNAAETEDLAAGIVSTGGVYLVPAFAGLGAPYWDPDARAALLGMTGATGRAEIVRAALESVCYQTRDLLEACFGDGAAVHGLRVDGGMVVNNWLVQYLSDILGVTVTRPVIVETTALGAASLAALRLGRYASMEALASHWREERSFQPQMAIGARNQRYAGWKQAVARVLTLQSGG